MMSSTLAPYSRFSKIIDIGIRVSRSTHAPLTFPGTLSTDGHWDQSIAPAGFSAFSAARFCNHDSRVRPCAAARAVSVAAWSSGRSILMVVIEASLFRLDGYTPDCHEMLGLQPKLIQLGG